MPVPTKNTRFQKATAAALILLMIGLLSAALPALSEMAMPQLTAAPLSTESAATNGMIRVWLSSIRSNLTYDLTISGAYTMGDTQLSNGSKVKVEFSGGTVYVTANGSRQSMGTSATLSRKSGGVKIAQSLASGNTYPGDMRFFYSGNTAYVVCTLYIEDYVYGVLPYEMDNGFPLEALKAQAVTARTYGLRARQSSAVYDVTDTTTHQVFRGVNYTKTRCIQAVDETWGIVLKYGSAFAGAYYSASNGGQTEAAQHVWGGAAIPYLSIKDDPYDLMNVRAVKKSYLIYGSPAQGTSAAAYTMIQEALAAKLGGSAMNYTINQITDILLHTPKYVAPSSLYTRMQVTLTYNSWQSATVDIPIFPTVESSLNLSINSDANELFTVEQEAKGFRVTSRRYGHGVGMSQRGAEQMGEAGIGYAQILGFYYTGATRVRMNLTTNWPALSQAPQAPQEADEFTGETQAKVMLENPNDRLNLRQAANDQSTILARIPHGSQVTILSAEGLWMKIAYGGQTGYVLRQYLVWEKTSEQTVPNAEAQRTAIVSLSSGSLNLRSEDRADAKILATIPNTSSILLLEEGATWSKVSYGGRVGYVMTKFLLIKSMPGEAEQPAQPSLSAGGQRATVSLANPSETLNFRLSPVTSAPILARLAQGTPLEVIERNEDWSKVIFMGQTGYVMNAFLAFSDEAAVTPAPDTQLVTPTPVTPMPMQQAQNQFATVSLPSGKLNLRVQPNITSGVYTTIPNGTRIEITQVGEDWCGALYDGFAGYVMRSCLAFDGDAQQAPTPTPLPVATQAEVSQALSDVVVQETPSALPTAPVAWTVTRDGDRVNLRKEQSTNAAIVFRVPYGEQVIVRAWGADWSQVAYGQYEGFMMTDFLSTEAFTHSAQVTETPSAVITPPIATKTPGGESAWVVSKDGKAVNLRKEKSTNSDVLTLISSGAEIVLLEAASDWCKVISKGLTGFVVTEFISMTPPDASQPITAAPIITPAETPAETIAETITAPPDASQPAIATPTAPPAETPAETIAETITPPPEVEPSPEPKRDEIYGDAKTTVVNSGKTRLNSPTATLHLRSAADHLAAQTGDLKQHDVVEVLQYWGDDWLYVRKGTMQGYALAEHFVLDYELAAIVLADTGSKLTVRAKASIDANAIGELSHGTLLTALGKEGNYTKVKLLDGTIGYVASDYVRYK